MCPSAGGILIDFNLSIIDEARKGSVDWDGCVEVPPPPFANPNLEGFKPA